MAKEEFKDKTPSQNPESSEKDQTTDNKNTKNKNDKKDNQEDELVRLPKREDHCILV
jgi:hypothetical protein